jgi:hypothetical protein
LAVGRCAGSRLEVPRQVVRLDLSQVFGDEDFYTYLCGELGIAVCQGVTLNRAISDRRVLLLLDQADVMSWEGFTNPVRMQLRGLAGSGQASPLKLVVAAREPLDVVFEKSGKPSPFENICIQEMMESWDATMIRQFIASRLGSSSMRFTEIQMGEVVQKSRGNPGKVMRACFELYRQYQGA